MSKFYSLNRPAGRVAELYVRENREHKERRQLFLTALALTFVFTILSALCIFTEHAWYWYLPLIALAPLLRWSGKKVFKYYKLAFYI